MDGGVAALVEDVDGWSGGGVPGPFGGVPGRTSIRAVASAGVTGGTAGQIGGGDGQRPAPLTVLVYSHRPEVREAIINAVGRRPAPDVGRVTFLEAGGVAEVLAACDAREADLAILDGEAQPTGGMGLSRQLMNEITDCPPVILTVRRRDDRWLGTWSQAAAVLVHPLDPLETAEVVAQVLREAQTGLPARG